MYNLLYVLIRLSVIVQKAIPLKKNCSVLSTLKGKGQCSSQHLHTQTDIFHSYVWIMFTRWCSHTSGRFLENSVCPFSAL